MLSDDGIEEYYLVKFVGGKIHINPRMGSLTTLCGQSMNRYHDGFIKGNVDFLAKFICSPYGCKTCRKSLETGGVGWIISTSQLPKQRLCIMCNIPLWDIDEPVCKDCRLRYYDER
jgi:hypothetical protein